MTTHGTLSLARHFLIRFIPLAVVCTLLALAFFAVENRTELQMLKQQEVVRVRSVVHDIERIISRRVIGDLNYISTVSSLTGYLTNPTNANATLLANDFKAFLHATRVYDDITLYDARGNSTVSATKHPFHHDAYVGTATKTIAQISAHHYTYFVSKIILRKQADTTVPILQFSMPVHANGKLYGILTISYLANDLFNRITEQTNKAAADTVLVVDNSGFRLRSPHPSKEGDAVHQHNQTHLPTANPTTWRLITTGTSGQFSAQDGLWTFERVDLLGKLTQNTHNHQHWLVISNLPQHELRRYRSDMLGSVVFIYVLAILIAAFTSWTLANARHQQQRAEEQTRDQLLRLQLLMDSTLEGIYGTDLSGVCIIANQSCATLLGYQHPSQLLGRHMHSLMHHTHPDGSSYPCNECKAHRVMHTGTVAIVENEVFWRKDGTPLPVAYTARPIVQNSTTIGLVCSFIDISERKKAQATQKRLLTILEGSLNEIYLFDIDSLRFEYANQAALHNLGYSLAELQKITACEIKPQIEESAFRRMLQPLLTGTQEKLEFQTTHRRKDGSSYPVEVHLQLVQPDERPSFLAIIFDSSEKMLLEEQLRQSQKMEAIGQLSSGVAHDFNNILQIISGNAQVIQMQACPDCPAAGRQQEILKAVERGVNLTRSMLAFARRQDLTLSSQELNLLVRESELLARKLLTAAIACNSRCMKRPCRYRPTPPYCNSASLIWSPTPAMPCRTAVTSPSLPNGLS